jgi:threonine dehydratase
VGVAALLAGKLSLGAGPVVFVLSGGNVDAATLQRIVAQEGRAGAAG